MGKPGTPAIGRMTRTICAIYGGFGVALVGAGVAFIHWPSALIVVGVLVISDSLIGSNK